MGNMMTRIKYNSFASVTDLTIKERRDMAKFCLQYCINTFGKPRKGIPTFSIINKMNGCYGEYDATIKHIIIYYVQCKTIGQFINTFIHEYTHHTQNLVSYDRILSKVGYDSHPQEIEANRMGKLHKQSCLESFRKTL
jgi:hypothetical protein